MSQRSCPGSEREQNLGPFLSPELTNCCNSKSRGVSSFPKLFSDRFRKHHEVEERWKKQQRMIAGTLGSDEWWGWKWKRLNKNAEKWKRCRATFNEIVFNFTLKQITSLCSNFIFQKPNQVVFKPKPKKSCLNLTNTTNLLTAVLMTSEFGFCVYPRKWKLRDPVSVFIIPKKETQHVQFYSYTCSKR